MRARLEHMRAQDFSIRGLALTDLDAIAAIHCAAFPRSLLTRLGPDAVMRYYAWQLLGRQETYTFGAVREGELTAYCFGGIFPVAIAGFLQQNVSLLARCVLRRPWLLADLLTRKRITSLVETVKRLALPPKAKPAASTEPKGRKRPFDILAIAVHPRLQGGGIGKALMRRAEEIALQNGFHVMTLMVATDNAPAVGFYESIGWSKALMNGRWRGNMVRWLDLSP